MHNDSSNSQLRLTNPASPYLRPDLPAWFLALRFGISLSFPSAFMILFYLWHVMFSDHVVRFVLRCIYICTPVRVVLSSAPKSAHLPVRWNSHQVLNWQKRSWSRELGDSDFYMHKVNSLFLPRPSNTCHTIPPFVVIPSGCRCWYCFLNLMGIPSLGPSGADAGLTQRYIWASGLINCLVFDWDSVFLSVSYFLNDFSLTMPRKLNITTACLKFEEWIAQAVTRI